MLNTFKKARSEYPRQFWLLFWGMMISTTGASMIWPFLMVYVTAKLNLPLTASASLMTLSAVMGLISSFIAGPIIDRVGRKWVMVISLIINACGYLLLSQAHTLLGFALVMSLNGAFNPLYRVGADAMMADLIPPEKRPEAYSLMRMSNNVGVALGPALGGFIAAISYTVAFFFAAGGLACYSLIIGFLAIETLPSRHGLTPVAERERFGGYGRIIRDRPFFSFISNLTLITICASLVWTLLAVYAKTNFQVPESQYGFIPTTNALMVVFLQYFITRVSKKFRALPVMAVGAAFYAVANLSIAFGHGFWAFWASMVVMTLGELILVPTSSTYAANLAPADMRGRYMSLYGLTWAVASGIGPILGGILNDNISPQSIWFGGAIVGSLSVIGFLILSRLFPRVKVVTVQTEKV